MISISFISRVRRRIIGTIVLTIAALFLPVVADARSQERQAPPTARGPRDMRDAPDRLGPQAQPPAEGRQVPSGIAPGELQLMFDGYALMQAQQILEISDEQFPRFLPRLKALQEARRRGQMQRQRVIQEIRRMTQPRAAAVEEGQLRDRLKLLDEIETRSADEIRQAMAALDQVLDIRQQARFRVFEETMEQRKVELLMRARQANRPPNRPLNRQPDPQ